MTAFPLIPPLSTCIYWSTHSLISGSAATCYFSSRASCFLFGYFILFSFFFYPFMGHTRLPGLGGHKPLVPCSHPGLGVSTPHSASLWLSFTLLFIYLCMPGIRKLLVRVNSLPWCLGSSLSLFLPILWSPCCLFICLCQEHTCRLVIMPGLRSPNIVLLIYLCIP